MDNVNVYNRSYWPIKEGYLCKNIEIIARNSNLVPYCSPKQAIKQNSIVAEIENKSNILFGLNKNKNLYKHKH
jgi:hypothetical protein